MWFCISSVTHKYLFAKQVKRDEGVQSQSPSGSPRPHMYYAAGLPLYQFWPLYCLLSRVMIPKLEILHFQCCYSIYHRSCELGGNTAFNVGTKITAPGAKVKRGWPVERAQVVDGLGTLVCSSPHGKETKFSAERSTLLIHSSIQASSLLPLHLPILRGHNFNFKVVLTYSYSGPKSTPEAKVSQKLASAQH